CLRSIDRFLKAYSDVYATQNAPGVAAFYTRDTVVPTNEFGVFHGRDAVSAFYQTAFDQGSDLVVVNHTFVEPDRHCQFAMVFGTFALTGTKNPGGPGTRS
ncbi:hypothetical protein AAVH_42655, partial [Aphelenchoides avenae]